MKLLEDRVTNSTTEFSFPKCVEDTEIFACVTGETVQTIKTEIY